MKRPQCPRCQRRAVKAAINAKWCAPCSAELRRRPRSTLTADQQRWLRSQDGKMNARQCAEALSTSLANVKRACRDMGISLRLPRYSPQVIRKVSRYYEKHGRPATQAKFPDVRVRSIVERNADYAPRQRRWQPDELRLAAVMVGFVPFDRQADLLQRPNAGLGSIRSVWTKTFALKNPCSLHGLPLHQAKFILRPGFPTLESPYMACRPKTTARREGCRYTVLWCEMEPWLRKDMPRWLRDAIRAMADFQRWLYADKVPRRAIEETMRIAGVA